MDKNTLRGEAIKYTALARSAEAKGNYREAVFYYIEAIDALHGVLLAQQNEGEIDQVDATMAEVDGLLKRAETLKSRLAESGKNETPVVASKEQQDLELAKFTFERAMNADEEGSSEEASKLYIQSVESFLNLAKSAKVTEELRNKSRKFAENAIVRAEELKKIKKTPSSDQATSSPHVHSAASSGPGLSDEEIRVLYHTSTLNGVCCLPFMPSDIRGERFAYPLVFVDSELSNGVLCLSRKQSQKLKAWVRLSDLSDNPSILGTLSPNAVKQTVVSDCSFVASLTVAAQCERRFQKPIISPQIFPQDRSGNPIYNPCGKYMIKLHLNGIWRKVIIDDQLPSDRHHRLLCSFSQNPNEFWVSILEKAYMKVMGGYDFPGSNSSIDLNALTGWIPERLSINSDVVVFDRNREFDRMMTRFHSGDLLITVATGEMSEDEEERTGLVQSHAYAVMDLRLIDGWRLLMVKNPWSHIRWKGKFSENDQANWTPSLQAKLGYDPRSARLNDNGIFWIDYDSLCRFFDVFYLSWNPKMFPKRFCFHQTWEAGSGPQKDVYNMSNNPQFRLEVKTSEKAVVWLVLTRHITERDDFAYNREFITLVIYKTQGRRVFYPSSPPPFIDGIRINSPHHLCKVKHDCGKNETYTVVVSQFEKSNTLHFTLNAYATCDFQLSKITDPYLPNLTRKVTGEWKGITAGGCPNNSSTYPNNPVYLLEISRSGEVLVTLKGPKQYAVGFSIYPDTGNEPFWSKSEIATSGTYRSGFCYLELKPLQAGSYQLVPTTFSANEEGPYILEVKSNVKLSLRRK